MFNVIINIHNNIANKILACFNRNFVLLIIKYYTIYLSHKILIINLTWLKNLK